MNKETFIQKHIDFASNSKLWVYPANRIITEAELEALNLKLKEFTKEWAAHGTQLRASFGILYQAFLVLIVDENSESPSGCSIDTSVKVIKGIGTQFNINFFDRNSVVYLNNGEISFTSLGDLSKLSNEIVFNTSVANFEDFKNKFELPFKESALANVNIDNSFSFSL